MRIVYLVEGSTGCYDDVRNWLVRGFYSLAAATKFNTDLQNKFEEVYKGGQDWYQDKDRANISDVMLEFDSRFDCDYNGVAYRIVEVEVEEDNV